jgi:glucoamylase
MNYAPGWPGIAPRWTSSAKSGVGTSLCPASRLWFTISHGIINELYYPRIDRACTRDMGLIVTDDHGWMSEEKRHAESEVHRIAAGVPAYHLRNVDRSGRYEITKDVLTDPCRPVLLQRTRFTARRGAWSDYHLFVLLAPHLGNRGAGNTAWVGDYKGVPMLFAERDGVALALASSAPWVQRSVGFAGASDGWHDLVAHGALRHCYDRAENGNVALTAEVALAPGQGEFVLAVGFGTTPDEAAHQARASLDDGFDQARAEYIEEWTAWQDGLLPLDLPQSDRPDRARISSMVLRIHAARDLPGGTIASLSIPWGFNKGDDDLGGYHLVWPRDLVQAAGGLLAVGAKREARDILLYLEATQEADGHWAQNMWLDGSPYWQGIQMDETALPILLVDLAWREAALDAADRTRFWPMVRNAAAYLVRNGPVSPEDRWEENPGYAPFTIGAEIAALLAAADCADVNDEPATARYLRETADAWYAAIDRWIYSGDGAEAMRHHCQGYYVRIAPADTDESPDHVDGSIDLVHAGADGWTPADHVVSPDALALVRFGLRAADDPRITDTVRIIDALLEVTTPVGPSWHRYNGDRYGEHADGSPFDGTGIGRAWPLLTGERAHFELAAGHIAEARRLLDTLEDLANEGGMIPEQTWDAPDIPERELFFGRPSGSAMPLVWAHAEHLKLLRSLCNGAVFDRPPQPVERYLVQRTVSPRTVWRFNQKIRSIAVGQALRIETAAPALVHWSSDDWVSAHDSTTTPPMLGMHVVDLPTETVVPGAMITFTFYWPEAGHWEGTDFSVIVIPPPPPPPPPVAA